MVSTKAVSTFPTTLKEFIVWESKDGCNDDIYSAKPVLEDFEIRVNEIFA